MTDLEQIVNLINSLGGGAKEAFIAFLAFKLGISAINWIGGVALAWGIARWIVTPIYDGARAVETMKGFRARLGTGSFGTLTDAELGRTRRAINNLIDQYLDAPKKT